MKLIKVVFIFRAILDSFNYYPITEDFKSFDELFLRINKTQYPLSLKEFYKNLESKLNNLKVFNDCCVIGSNPEIIIFQIYSILMRIFFENEKN